MYIPIIYNGTYLLTKWIKCSYMRECIYISRYIHIYICDHYYIGISFSSWQYRHIHTAHTINVRVLLAAQLHRAWNQRTFKLDYTVVLYAIRFRVLYCSTLNVWHNCGVYVLRTDDSEYVPKINTRIWCMLLITVFMCVCLCVCV